MTFQGRNLHAFAPSINRLQYLYSEDSDCWYICRQYETGGTNQVFECRWLDVDVTPPKPLERDRDPCWLQVNISITAPSVTPTLRRHNPI